MDNFSDDYHQSISRIPADSTNANIQGCVMFVLGYK